MSNEHVASEEVGAAVPGEPPRENIVRAVMPGPELRDDGEDGRTLHGHFAVFDNWTEIDSIWEGNFLERIAPGAFKKTFAEQTPKVLYDHGQDPSIGNKPLGPIKSLSEDERGASYEVELLDTSYNRDLIPALRAGLLGASFRFRVMREDIDKEPGESDHNPKGLPERTIREAKVMEFGPVTFPAYKEATAGVRSLTDEYIMRGFLEHPERLRALLQKFLPDVGDSEEADSETEETTDAPDEVRAEPEAHPEESRRVSNRPLFGLSQETEPTWHL